MAVQTGQFFGDIRPFGEDGDLLGQSDGIRLLVQQLFQGFRDPPAYRSTVAGVFTFMSSISELIVSLRSTISRTSAAPSSLRIRSSSSRASFRAPASDPHKASGSSLTRSWSRCRGTKPRARGQPHRQGRTDLDASERPTYCSASASSTTSLPADSCVPFRAMRTSKRPREQRS